eukprot:6491336-Amphidinium_carterae.1
MCKSLFGTDWQMNEDIHRHLEEIFNNLGGTVAVESSFQRARLSEDQRPDRSLTHAQTWLSAIRGGVLSDMSFSVVDVETVPEEGLDKKAIFPASMFEPKVRDCTMKDAKKICGLGAPSWQHYNPEGSRKLVTEGLAMQLHSTNAETLQKSWRSQLLLPGLLLYNEAEFKGKLFFSIYCDACVAVLWPACVTPLGKQRYWELDDVSNKWELQVVSVMSLNSWKVLPYRYTSPCEHWKQQGGTMHPLPPSYLLQTKPRPVPLLNYLAESAFENVDEDCIDDLLIHDFHETVEGMTYAETVQLAITKVLKVSPDEALQIMEVRFGNHTENNDIMELLQTEEAASTMSTADLKEAEKEFQQEMTSKDKLHQLKDHVSTHRATGKQQKRRKAISFPGAADLPLDPIELRQLLPLPEEGRVWRDQFCKRWQAWYKQNSFSASRSWGSA